MGYIERRRPPPAVEADGPPLYSSETVAGKARAVGRRLSAAGRARLKAGISSR